jgi:hypothetical protein
VNIHDRRKRKPKDKADTSGRRYNPRWHCCTHQDQHAEDHSCTATWPVLREMLVCPYRVTAKARTICHTIAWIKRTFERSSYNKRPEVVFFPVAHVVRKWDIMNFHDQHSWTNVDRRHQWVSINVWVGSTGG